MSEQAPNIGKPGSPIKQPARLYVWLKRFFFSLLTLTVLVLVAAGAATYVIAKRGGPTAFVNTMISKALPGAKTHISSVSFDYDLNDFLFTAQLQDTSLVYQEQHLNFETVKLVFGVGSLRTALPVEIALQAQTLKVERQKQAVKFLDEFSWLNQMVFFPMPNRLQTAEQVNRKSTDMWPSGLQRLTLIADEFVISSSIDGQLDSEQFSDLALSFWPADKGGMSDEINLSLRLSQPVKPGQIIPQISLSLNVNFLSSLSVFELKTKHVDVTRLLKLMGQADRVKQHSFSDVNMELAGAFEGQSLSLLRGEMSSSKGSLSFQKDDNPLTSDYFNLQAKLDYSAADDILIIHNLSAKLADQQTVRLAGKLFSVHADEMRFTGTILGEDISIPALHNAWPKDQAVDVRSWISQHMAGGRFKTLAVEFEGGLRPDQGLMTVSQLNLSGEYANIRLSYSDDQYQTVVGTLKGSIDVKVGADGKVETAAAALSVRNGFMRVAGYGSTVRVPSVDLIVRQQGSDTILQNLFIDLEQSGQISLSGTRKKADDVFVTNLALTSEFLDVELFKHLWPKGLASKTALWTHQHISSGIFGRSQLSLVITEQDEQPKLVSVSGDVLFDDVQFHLYQDLIPATSLSGLLKFRDNQLTLNIKKGVIEHLSVQQAQIGFGPLFPVGRERNLNVRLLTRGDVSTVLSVLGHSRINQLKKLKLESKPVTGETEFTMELAAVASPGNLLKVSNVAVSGSMSNASIQNLPLQHNLEQADIVLTFQQGSVQVSGSGLLSGVKTDFAYQTSADDMNLTIKTKNEAAVTAYMKDRYNLPVDQAMSLKVSVTGQPRKRLYKANITADATDTSVSLPIFDWAKLPGEVGTANMQMIFEDNRLHQIEAIDINASSLKAKGRLAFDADLSINHGYLEQIILPGHRIDTLLLERNKNGVMKITAEGDQFNLIPLRRSEGLAKGRDLIFDITSEAIVLGPAISFSGRLEGQTTKQGGGEAQLQGSLIVNGRPLLNEGTLEALFGNQGEFLTAVGVIGGAEAELTYSPSDTGENILLITSKNGGRVLDGLRITDTIRGGALRMATTFSVDSFSKYRTEIELTDFNVVEAPKAIRAFSVLSVAGLSSLVEGEGTHFSKGQAIIDAESELFRLEKVRAVGEAVGVHFLGSYDKQNREVNISGDLIPLKQLSKLIGYVPFVGELLTGMDKTGIFSTQFTMTGDIDDADVGINLFALAPGLLRDILSPNWLGNERRRILGVDEPASASR